jgi:hypothetical protein
MSLPAGLVAFLSEQPGMRLVVGAFDPLRLRGTYLLDATHASAGHVHREYQLELEVPANFPAQAPVVFETEGTIPRHPDYHVNLPANSLCLGSPLALRRLLRACPDLQQFLARSLRPYLYAVTVKLDTGQDFVFGELRHGPAGQLQDLADDLQLAESQVVGALDLLLMPRETANALPCPCQCGQVLGSCALRERLDEVRDLASETLLRRLRNEFAALLGEPG